MAQSISFPNSIKLKLINGDIDLANDTLKAMLLTSSHSTDIDTQEFADDISSNEISSSGSYTAGFGNRITLGSLSTSQDNTNDLAKFDYADIQLISFTSSPAFLAVIKEVTSDADSPIIGIEDFDGVVTATNGTWDYTVNSSGWATLS